MRVADAEGVLLGMLAAAGVRPGPLSAAEVPVVVEVFRRFAAVPVQDAAGPDEDGDGVLAQYGTDTLSGRREFTADLTRQWVRAGQDAPMWQLSCALRRAATPETEASGADSRWSFGRPLEVFFAEVLARPGWVRTCHEAAGPARLVVTFDEV